jgi:PKD repeat protein
MRLSPLRRLRALHRVPPEQRSLGQSLVEFALTLPVLLFLTLIALDFGRVYLGYINLQNMARIAANFAANHPDAWGVAPDADAQTQYRSQILADASAINCRLPQASGVTVVPTPDFIDGDSDGNTNQLGDRVTVALNCTFDVITPGISSVLGGTVAVSAASTFPVKTGVSYVEAAVDPSPTPLLPNAAFTGNDVLSSHAEHAVTVSDSFTTGSPTMTVQFRDTSGGNPISWAWDFGDGTSSSTQDPLDHTYTCASTSCTFTVKLTVDNLYGSSPLPAYMDITMVQSPVAFAADKTQVKPNAAVNFTDKSTPGGTSFAWKFGDGTTASTENPSHAYAAEGTYDVELTVTYPSPTGPQSVTKSSYITVAWGFCLVPSLTAVRFNDADAIYRGSPYNFSGHVVRDAGAPSGNFLILIQSWTATSYAPCNSDIKVTTP